MWWKKNPLKAVAESHASESDNSVRAFWTWFRQLNREWLERAKMRDQLFALGVAIIIGILCGFGAVGFRKLIHPGVFK